MRIIQQTIYVAIVVWATMKLYDVKATYPFMTNKEMLIEYWYYVVAIGLAMSQIMHKEKK
jgi:hypothetical protein